MVGMIAPQVKARPASLKIVVGLIIFQAVLSAAIGGWQLLLRRDDVAWPLSLVSIVLAVVHLSNARALNSGSHRARVVMTLAVSLHAISAAFGLASGEWIGVPQIAFSAYIVAILLNKQTRAYCA